MAQARARVGKVKLRRNQLLAGETLLRNSFALVFPCLIQDVIQLMRHHTPERSPIQRIAGLPLAWRNGRGDRTAHAVAQHGTKRLHLSIHSGAVGERNRPLWTAFVNEERVEGVQVAIAFEMDDHQVRKGLAWFDGLERPPVKFHGLTSPNLGEFGLQCLNHLRLRAALLKTHHERDRLPIFQARLARQAGELTGCEVGNGDEN